MYRSSACFYNFVDRLLHEFGEVVFHINMFREVAFAHGCLRWVVIFVAGISTRIRFTSFGDLAVTTSCCTPAF